MRFRPHVPLDVSQVSDRRLTTGTPLPPIDPLLLSLAGNRQSYNVPPLAVPMGRIQYHGYAGPQLVSGTLHGNIPLDQAAVRRNPSQMFAGMGAPPVTNEHIASALAILRSVLAQHAPR